MTKMKPDAVFPFADVRKETESDHVTITIGRIDRADFAEALRKIADRRDAQAKTLKPEKRQNLEARAIRLRRIADEIMA